MGRGSRSLTQWTGIERMWIQDQVPGTINITKTVNFIQITKTKRENEGISNYYSFRQFQLMKNKQKADLFNSSCSEKKCIVNNFENF